MTGKITTVVALGILLLPFAVMITGCQQETQQAEQSATPQQTVESTSSEQKEIDTLMKSYLELRRLLAEDKLDGASATLTTMGEAAERLTNSDNAQVKASAEELVGHAAAQPDDLENVRKRFEEISAAMIDLVKLVPPSDAVAEKLYVMYCPMVKASWLQSSEEIHNPYMGAKMLECGEVRETITTGES